MVEKNLANKSSLEDINMEIKMIDVLIQDAKMKGEENTKIFLQMLKATMKLSVCN